MNFQNTIKFFLITLLAQLMACTTPINANTEHSYGFSVDVTDAFTDPGNVKPVFYVSAKKEINDSTKASLIARLIVNVKHKLFNFLVSPKITKQVNETVSAELETPFTCDNSGYTVEINPSVQYKRNKKKYTGKVLTGLQGKHFSLPHAYSAGAKVGISKKGYLTSPYAYYKGEIEGSVEAKAYGAIESISPSSPSMYTISPMVSARVDEVGILAPITPIPTDPINKNLSLGLSVGWRVGGEIRDKKIYQPGEHSFIFKPEISPKINECSPG